MMGYENYRASENEDDFWISHLGSWVDDGCHEFKREIHNFGFDFER